MDSLHCKLRMEVWADGAREVVIESKEKEEGGVKGQGGMEREGKIMEQEQNRDSKR